MNKVSGFLLSYIKYGDNDAIIHCYTLELGFKSFFLRGVYSKKNKKKAFLIPLNELILTISSPLSNSKLDTIKKVETSEDFFSENDIYKNAVCFFVADFLNQILRSEQKNEFIYEELRNLIQNLNQKNYNSHYFFLIKILFYFGINPLVSSGKFLNIEKGVFQDENNSGTVDDIISEIWKNILENKISYDFKIKNAYKKKLLDSILLYYKYHFPEFYSPKSIAVISEIFE